jgi:hypothetical protein
MLVLASPIIIDYIPLVNQIKPLRVLMPLIIYGGNFVLE